MKVRIAVDYDAGWILKVSDLKTSIEGIVVNIDAITLKRWRRAMLQFWKIQDEMVYTRNKAIRKVARMKRR